VSAQATPRIHLAVLSNSAISTYRACARLYEHKYVKLRRPRRASEALRFGSFFHVGLNAWWITIGDANDKYTAAIHAMRDRAEERAEDADPFDLVKAEELIRGYTVRWSDERYETIAVEREFSVDLVNPATGAASRTYRLVGAIDVVARLDGRIIHVEHKTTSDDIGAGSDYWRMVSALDPQVSTYQSALKSLGLEAAETLYDVVRKVGLIPAKATPEENRKYKQEKSRACKFCSKKGNPPGVHKVSVDDEPDLFCNGAGRVITEPGGQLYAGQRESDETVEEFRARVQDHIAANPERYFARGPIVRLERDEREHARDVWQTTQMIKSSENAGSFPRSPGSCRRFHSLCEFFEVCSGNASLDDDSRFRTADRAHEELKEV